MQRSDTAKVEGSIPSFSTMFNFIKDPKELMMELANYARSRRLFDSIKYYPGDMIKSLTTEQREILKKLKADDLKDVRI